VELGETTGVHRGSARRSPEAFGGGLQPPWD
jgi:hypothetical protein